MSGGRTRRIGLGRGGEFDLIRDLLGPEEDLPEGVVLGVGDDCAVLDGGWVLSTDLSLEDVHFHREWISLEEAGFRAAAGALSDLAAMAARPVGALLSMALGPENAHEEAHAVQKGVRAACGEVGAAILGGDLAQSRGGAFLSVTVIGQARSPVGRSGTLPGDELWVTGRLGGSAGAVSLWQEGITPTSSLRELFASPRPRIREALWLQERVPLHGLIDLSDGLAGDAGHLAAAAGVAMILLEDRIPVHPSLLEVLEDRDRCLDLALGGGEDFELCFTVPPGALDDWAGPFEDSFRLPLTKVGRAEAGEGVFLEAEGEGRRAVVQGGYDHFSDKETGW